MQCDWLKLIGARCNKAFLLLFVDFWVFEPLQKSQQNDGGQSVGVIQKA